MSDSIWLLNARNNQIVLAPRDNKTVLNINTGISLVCDTNSRYIQIVNGVDFFTFADVSTDALVSNDVIVISTNNVNFFLRHSMDSSTILTKYAGETRTFYMEFANLLSGQTIDSATIESHLRGGGVSDLVINSSSIVGTQVEFSISGGTLRNTYHINITVNLSDNQVVIGNGLLTILGQ